MKIIFPIIMLTCKWFVINLFHLTFESFGILQRLSLQSQSCAVYYLL
jgi:hypothetical protein